MESYFTEDDVELITEPMAKAFEKQIKTIYKNVSLGDSIRGFFSVKAELDPYLHGYWGPDLHTMTSQASKMGIPSI